MRLNGTLGALDTHAGGDESGRICLCGEKMSWHQS
jgi:hypothetical protein